MWAQTPFTFLKQQMELPVSGRPCADPGSLHVRRFYRRFRTQKAASRYVTAAHEPPNREVWRKPLQKNKIHNLRNTIHTYTIHTYDPAADPKVRQAKRHIRYPNPNPNHITCICKCSVIVLWIKVRLK